MNKQGTINNKANVPINIPPTAPVPNERFPLAPTPLETINGSKPNIIVRAVIKIGRRRTFAALRAAEVRLIPDKRRWVAYSVNKMAVFANNPINMIKPVCR